MGFTPIYDFRSLGVLIGTVGGGVMTAGSAALGPVGFTPLPGRPTADYFSPADVGRIVTVMGAGVGGGILIAKIVTYVDTQNVVLSNAAVVSVTAGISNTTVFRPAKIKAETIQYRRAINSVNDCQFEVENLSGEYPPVEGQPFLLTSTDPSVGQLYGTFFGGEIDSVETTALPGTVPRATTSVCRCVSYKAVLERRVMMGASFSSSDQQTIAAFITNYWTVECIGLVTVTGPAVAQFTIEDYTFLSEALDALMQAISDATNSYFYTVDQWRIVHIANQSTTAAPWSVSDTGLTDGNVRVTVSATSSRDRLANQKYLKASKALGDAKVETLTNSFLGSPIPTPRRELFLKNKAGALPQLSITSLGSRRIWVSPVDPRNDATAVTIPVGYDWAWPIDSDYLFCDGSRPGVPSGATATTTYRVAFETLKSYLYNPSVTERSAVQGGSGIHEVVENTDKALTVAEIQALVQSSTIGSATVPKSVMLESFRGGLNVGQGLTVHLTELNVTVNYLIESVTLVEESGWVRWDIKASIGALLGDWVKGMVDALSPNSAGGTGISGVSGSVLDVSFAGGNGQETIPYSSYVIGVGGSPGYTYGVASGSLPTGVTLNTATGALTGTPTTAGTYTFTVSVIDSQGNTASHTWSIEIVTAPAAAGGENTGTCTAVTAGQVGSAYQDPVDKSLHLVIHMDVTTVADTVFPIRVRCFIDFDDGNGAINLGDRYVQSASENLLFGRPYQETGIPKSGDLYVPTDPTNVNWRAYVEANSHSELPTTGVAVYSDFVVEAAQPVPPTDLRDIQFLINPDTSDYIDYALSDGGTYFCAWHGIGFYQPTARSNPYFKNCFFTVQLGYSTTGTVVVTGGVNCAISGDTVAAGDVGERVHIAGVTHVIATWVDATHFTITTPATNGSGLAFEHWHQAPINAFFGNQGRDDDTAASQGYWGRRFTDGPAPYANTAPRGGVIPIGALGTPHSAPAVQSLARLFKTGIDWDIFPTEYPDTGAGNPYRTYRVYAFGVSRLADNQLGGTDTITYQTQWLSGQDYGDFTPAVQAPATDLRQVSRALSYADTTIAGGNGAKQKVNIGYTIFIDALGKVAVNNLPSLGSLPTLPSATYPAGAVIQLSTNGKLYRSNGFTWFVSSDPADLAVGALASGVTLNAAQVNAGTFNGIQLILNLNGVTTSVTNQFDSTFGQFVGIKSTLNSNGDYSALSWFGCIVNGASGGLRSEQLAGNFRVVNSFGEVIRLDGSSSFTAGIQMSGLQVLRARQTGPGNPVFTSLADVQAWCQAAHNALRGSTGHGIWTG
jgi:hypothetical protein